MPGFFGYQTVQRTLRKHFRTGKVKSGTLKYRTKGSGDTFTSITWTYLYVWPAEEVSGLQATGFPDINGVITLYRSGEAVAPRADDQIVVDSVTNIIKQVTPRLNADEAIGSAVYDCLVTN